MANDMECYLPFMGSVRDNFMSLSEVLSETECRYEYDDVPIGEPDPDFNKTVEFWNENGITVPPSIIAFFTTIGHIEFTGSAPVNWSGCETPDPISVAPASLAYITDEYDMWTECKESFLTDFLNAQFANVMAGDHIHKSGFSGGLYHLIFDDQADAFVTGELINHRFCDYLKLCDMYGGFPGLRFFKDHNWPLSRLKQKFKPLPELPL